MDDDREGVPCLVCDAQTRLKPAVYESSWVGPIDTFYRFCPVCQNQWLPLASEVKIDKTIVERLLAQREKDQEELNELRSWVKADTKGMIGRMFELFQDRRDSDEKVKQLTVELARLRVLLNRIKGVCNEGRVLDQ